MAEMVKHSARSRAARVMVCLSVIGLLAAANPVRAEADKGSQWAPAEAVFYLGCGNVHELFEAYKTTEAYKQSKDPKLEKSQGQFMEMLKPQINELLGEMGFGSVEELEKMGMADMMSDKLHPRGAMCIFAAAGPDLGGDKGPRPDLAVVADMGEDFGRFKELFEKFIQTRLDKGGKKDTTEYNEVSIVTISNEGGAKPAKDEDSSDDEESGDDEDSESSSGGDAPPPVTYAFKDKTVLICSNVDVAKETLRRMKEKQPDCLAGSEDYGSLERACSPVGQIRIFFNLPRLLTLVEKYDKGSDVKTMEKLGLKDWKPVVGTVRIASPKGVESSMQLNVPMGSAGKGLAKLLAMKNGPIAPPAHIDADTSMLMNIHVSPGQFYDDLLALMDKVDPDAAKSMRADDEISMGEKEEKMSVRNDILGNMDAPYNVAVGIRKPFGPGSLRFLMTLAHKNRAAIEKLMGFAPPGLFVKRDLMGQQVYDIGQLPIQGISMAVTDKLIAVGGERSIEATIRSSTGKADSLADAPAFKSIAQHLPKECWFTIYADGTRINRFLTAIMKQSDSADSEEPKKSDDEEPLSTMISGFLPMMLAGAGPGMSPEVLEAQQKYAGRTLFTIGTKGDSIDINMVSVAGEGDK